MASGLTLGGCLRQYKQTSQEAYEHDLTQHMLRNIGKKPFLCTLVLDHNPLSFETLAVLSDICKRKATSVALPEHGASFDAYITPHIEACYTEASAICDFNDVQTAVAKAYIGVALAQGLQEQPPYLDTVPTDEGFMCIAYKRLSDIPMTP